MRRAKLQLRLKNMCFQHSTISHPNISNSFFSFVSLVFSQQTVVEKTGLIFQKEGRARSLNRDTLNTYQETCALCCARRMEHRRRSDHYYRILNLSRQGSGISFPSSPFHSFLFHFDYIFILKFKESMNSTNIYIHIYIYNIQS